jgi:hypothetical protein
MKNISVLLMHPEIGILMPSRGIILALLDNGPFHSKIFQCNNISIIWLYLPLFK